MQSSSRQGRYQRSAFGTSIAPSGARQQQRACQWRQLHRRLCHSHSRLLLGGCRDGLASVREHSYGAAAALRSYRPSSSVGNGSSSDDGSSGNGNADGRAALLHPTLQLIRDRHARGGRPGQHSDNCKLGLVIEGGGMQGIISGAMCLRLSELGLRDTFDAVYGASAGAINGAYFITGQDDGLDVYTEFCTDGRFLDLSQALIPKLPRALRRYLGFGSSSSSSGAAANGSSSSGASGSSDSSSNGTGSSSNGASGSSDSSSNGTGSSSNGATSDSRSDGTGSSSNGATSVPIASSLEEEEEEEEVAAVVAAATSAPGGGVAKSMPSKWLMPQVLRRYLGWEGGEQAGGSSGGSSGSSSGSTAGGSSSSSSSTLVTTGSSSSSSNDSSSSAVIGRAASGAGEGGSERGDGSGDAAAGASRPAMDLEYLLGTVMETGRPLDWQAIIDSPLLLKVVASSLDLLQPILLQSFASKQDLVDCIAASATVPEFAGPPRLVRGHRCVDAAVFEPVPVISAIADGCTHVLVLCSRPPSAERGKKKGTMARMAKKVVETVVKQTFLNADYMSEAWRSDNSSVSYIHDELLLGALYGSPTESYDQLGAYVLPLYPTSSRGANPICVDKVKLLAAREEGCAVVQELIAGPLGLPLPAAAAERAAAAAAAKAAAAAATAQVKGGGPGR